MNYLPKWLAQVLGASKFNTAVERIVARVEAPLWDRLAQAGTSMSVFEATGYIRARAMVLVSRELRQELTHPVSNRHRQRLQSAVLERLLTKTTPQLTQPAQPQLTLVSRHAA